MVNSLVQLRSVVGIYSPWMNRPLAGNLGIAGEGSVSRLYAEIGGLDPNRTEITMYCPLRMIPSWIV